MNHMRLCFIFDSVYYEYVSFTGADNLKGDGTYSKYFTRVNNGRYNLKVQVKHHKGDVSGSPSRLSGALYVPGYIVDGKVTVVLGHSVLWTFSLLPKHNTHEATVLKLL